MLALPLFLVSCGRPDDSFEWAEKPHAISSSGWCVAYVQEAKDASGSEWTAVLLDFDRGKCSGTAIQFQRIGLSLKMHWLDPTTLEVHYPKDVSPTCDTDASEHFVECDGFRVRVVPSKI